MQAFESDESDGAADGEPRQTVGRPRGKKKAIGDDGGDEDLIFDAFEPGTPRLGCRQGGGLA